jgi:hypothetical protein
MLETLKRAAWLKFENWPAVTYSLINFTDTVDGQMYESGVELNNFGQSLLNYFDWSRSQPVTLTRASQQ